MNWTCIGKVYSDILVNYREDLPECRVEYVKSHIGSDTSIKVLTFQIPLSKISTSIVSTEASINNLPQTLAHKFLVY